MDELTEIFDADFSVSAIPNDPVRKHPRYALFKGRNRRPDQEERRRRILEEQKQRRSELFNVGRDLILTLEENEEFSDSDDDDDDGDDIYWSKPKNTIENTGQSSRFESVTKITKCPPRLYKDKLMFSEWLVEVPDDLEEEWYMVPCPEGHRTLVVAYKCRTMAFSKSGFNTASFKSLLPGGSHMSERGCTQLDCIWSSLDHTYYILDVLSWGNQSMVDCETEFRFYWLRTKLHEMEKLGRASKENYYIFKSLHYYQCTKEVMTDVMAKSNIFSYDGPILDGLLFYHSKTHYVPGHTPLVGWLKPYMMPEMLDVQIAAVYQQEDMECKPNTSTKKKAKAKNKKKAKKEQEMETSNPVECNTSDLGMECGAD